MKVTFFSLGISTDAIGIRILSSILKQRGHQVQLVFLPSIEDLHRRATGTHYDYAPDVLQRIVEICRDSDLLGISLMTHHVSVARALTSHLKKHVSAPVAWGGIHPTVCPVESLEFADIVNVGDGETSVPQLIDRMAAGDDIAGIPGVWVKKNGSVVPTGGGPLTTDLDSLPFPDYSFDGHYLMVDEHLEPMTPDNWRQHLMKFFPPLNQGRVHGPAYQILTARGCPFRCTFCGETPLEENVYGASYFRRRSVPNLIKELRWALDSFPFLGEICFCDDTFTSRPLKEIKEFADSYKREIGLPFYILTSPANVSSDKIDTLVDAGLTNIGMGIQSGSSKTLDLYGRQRVGSVEQSLKAAHVLNKHKDKLTPYYDFIIENPFETREDLAETVRLLIRLPRPYRTRVYALSFFPGTKLFEHADAAGLLHASMYDKTFGQRTQTGYLSLIIDMNKYNLPKPLLLLLASRPFLFAFNREPVDKVCLKLHKFLKWLSVKTGINDSGLS